MEVNKKNLVFMGLCVLGSVAVFADVSPDQPAPEHSNFGSFFVFETGELAPQSECLERCMAKFGKYVKKSHHLSEFEQGELALLMRQITYHHDTALELRSFHLDPVGYATGSFVEGYRPPTLFDDLGEWARRQIFRTGVFVLAHEYIRGYYSLSPEEQKKSSTVPYDDNGVCYEDPGLRIHDDARTVSDSLMRAGIRRTPDQVLAEAKKVTGELMDEHCKDPKSHECLYAKSLNGIVKLAKKTV